MYNIRTYQHLHKPNLRNYILWEQSLLYLVIAHSVSPVYVVKLTMKQK